MAVEEIPEDVERLLLEDVESYEQLEALILLVENAHRPLSTADVATSIGAPDDAALAALDHLRARGLLVATEEQDQLLFRYAAQPGLDASIRTLGRMYAERPVEIAKRMTANAIERLRTAAIRTFSDAFLLRRRDDG